MEPRSLLPSTPKGNDPLRPVRARFPMPATFTCPNAQCRRITMVPLDRLGRSAPCLHCGQKFIALTTGESLPIPEARPTRDASGCSTQDGAKALPVLPVESPQLIARFVVRERLGAGAFGQVYRAYDPQL